ncbi:hypothetical protein, partial [Pseudomonas sp. BF-RE-02]|uniref:hypothetical protein n=1 Tax=Pseudomonas sp. BF-RE-02 TaxID=2832360 RepID=UPI001CC093E1
TAVSQMNRSDAIASKPAPTNPGCPSAPGFFSPANCSAFSVKSSTDFADTALYRRLLWQLSPYTSKLFRYCFTQE